MKILEMKSLKKMRLLKEEICFNELNKLILGICEYANITTDSDTDAENKIREVAKAYSITVQELISSNEIALNEKIILTNQFKRNLKLNITSKSYYGYKYFMFNEINYSDNIKFLLEVLKVLPVLLTRNGILQYESIKNIYPAIEETLIREKSFIYNHNDKFDFFKHVLSFKGIFLPYDEEDI